MATVLPFDRPAFGCRTEAPPPVRELPAPRDLLRSALKWADDCAAEGDYQNALRALDTARAFAKYLLEQPA